MTNAKQLSRVDEKLVKRCSSRDPFEIARQLGINVMLCENFGSLKGMYRVINCAGGTYTITIQTSACDRASLFPQTVAPYQCRLLPTSHHTARRHLYIRR